MLLTFFLVKSLSELISVFIKTWPFCIALKCRKNLDFCLLIFKFDLIRSLAPYIWKLLIILEVCHTMLFFLFNIGVKTEVKTWNIEQLNTKKLSLSHILKAFKIQGAGLDFLPQYFLFHWMDREMHVFRQFVKQTN